MTATILKDLAGRIARKNIAFPVPNYLDRLRFTALIAKHIA